MYINLSAIGLSLKILPYLIYYRYRADHTSGYVAEVTYEGVAKPYVAPAKPAYAPAPPPPQPTYSSPAPKYTRH